MPRAHNVKHFRRRETVLSRTSRSDIPFDARTAIEQKKQHIDRFLRDCQRTEYERTQIPQSTTPAEPTFLVTIPRTAPHPSSITTAPLAIEQRPTSPACSQVSSVVLSLSTVSRFSACEVEPVSTVTQSAPLSRHQRRKLRLRKFRENNPDAVHLSRRERKKANRIQEEKKQATAHKKREDKRLRHQKRIENADKKRAGKQK